MRYRLLGRSGLRVSELCLGTMTFGDDWGWGADKVTSRVIFDRFWEAGGNFIDTANNYTNGSSEQFIGEFIASQRDQFVIATKYTLTENPKNPNAGGNSRKNMMRSVEGSLKRLNTTYIDVLYLHMWDYMTPVEEVLRGVDDLIHLGKVLYFAFSDTPAWVVSYALAMAESRGWVRPIGLQIPYSLADRSAERDLLPMARNFDLAVMPWGILESGGLTGKYNESKNDEPRRENDVSEQVKKLASVIINVAKEIGCSPSQVAINWIRQQLGNFIPILGVRTERQIKDNLACLDFTLSDKHIKRLTDATDFKPGFPASFLHDDSVRGLIFGNSFDLIDIR